MVVVLLGLQWVGSGRAQNLIPTVETFTVDRQKALDLAEAGDWKEAHEVWLALVRDHAGKDYVRSKLPEIREALKRSEFWTNRKRPNPKDLVSGSLKKYSRTSGKVRILYGAGDTGDFEKDGDFMLHPMIFRKSYFVELEAKPATLAKQSIIVDFDGESGYLVGAGDWVKGELTYMMHHMVKITRKGQELIERVDPKVRKAKDGNKLAKLRVMVDGSNIKVRYNGRQVLSTRRKSGSLGRIAFLSSVGFTKLTIDGTAEVSWLEGLVDASVQTDWDAFQASYNEPTELGAWGPAVVAKKSTRDLEKLLNELTIPGKHTRHQVQCINRAMDLINARKTKECAELLGTFNPLECPPATREMLMVLSALNDRQHGKALHHIEALVKLEKPDLAVRTLEAILLTRVERLSDAQAKLETLVTDEPNDTAFHAELAHVLMLQGDLDKARKRLEVGLNLSPSDQDLLDLRVQLAKASQGPSWRRSHREETDHFVVGSNLDKRATRVVARVADQAMAQYVARFGSMPGTAAKLPLYLFSGKNGYEAYIQGVADETVESSLGVFSQVLKQILVWNQSDRKGLIRVVRHEVMHAYMDRLIGYSPPWLAEGLSEYCAESMGEKGEWLEGGVSQEHFRTFERYGQKKLTVEKLLFMPHAEFMVNADYTYAMSWSFVYFLLTSTPENRALFDGIWGELKGAIGPIAATHKIFDPVDLKALDRAFWKHVRSQMKLHR